MGTAPLFHDFGNALGCLLFHVLGPIDEVSARWVLTQTLKFKQQRIENLVWACVGCKNRLHKFQEFCFGVVGYVSHNVLKLKFHSSNETGCRVHVLNPGSLFASRHAMTVRAIPADVVSAPGSG